MRITYWLSTAFTLLGAGGAQAASEAWHITERSGQVMVLHAGMSTVAMSGSAVVPGDFVETGHDGRAVLVRGEDYIVVAPGSHFRAVQPTQSGDLLQIVQDAGNLIYKIKHLATPHFAVKTPYLAAVVKGTTFSITVNAQGSAIQVINGAVDVATPDGGAHQLVTTGMIGKVFANAPLRLNVVNATTSVVVSSKGKTPALPATASPSAENPVSSGAVVGAANVITTAISEPATSLNTATRGLVDGNTSFAVTPWSLKDLSASSISATTAILTAVNSAASASSGSNSAAASTTSKATPTTPTSVAAVTTTPVVGEPTPVAAVTTPVVAATTPVVAATTPVAVTTTPVMAAATTTSAVVSSSNGNGNSGLALGIGSGNGGGNGNGNSGNGNGNGGSVVAAAAPAAPVVTAAAAAPVTTAAATTPAATKVASATPTAGLTALQALIANIIAAVSAKMPVK